MKLITLYAACFVLLLCISFSSSGQDTTIHNGQFRSSHSIRATAGFAQSYYSGHLSYERIIDFKLLGDYTFPFVRIGTGVYSVYDDVGFYGLAQVGLLMGKNKQFFEISAGPSLYSSAMQTPPISGLLAWRYSDPQNGYIFRAGIGFPECIFIGLGMQI